MAHDLVTELLQYSSLACFMAIWQLCANLLIPNCLRSNLSYSPLAALELYVNRYKSKIFGNKKRAAFYSRPSKHSDYRKVSLKIIRILLFNREFINTLAEILFARTQHHTWEARLVGRIGIMLCFETQSTAMRINHT